MQSFPQWNLIHFSNICQGFITCFSHSQDYGITVHIVFESRVVPSYQFLQKIARYLTIILRKWQDIHAEMQKSETNNILMGKKQDFEILYGYSPQHLLSPQFLYKKSTVVGLGFC